MDERGYVAQALLDRLHDDGVRYRVLGDEEVGERVALVVSNQEFPAMPRRVARFAQDFDLGLVQLARIEHQRWRFVLAWSDEVGRPSFLTLTCVADYCRAGRRHLRAEELLTGAPDALFFYALAEALEDQSIDEARGAWLSALWHSDPRGAIERIGLVWRQRRDVRLLAQGAKHGKWHAVRAALPHLRRGLRRAAWPLPAAALPRAQSMVHPASAC